MSKPPYPTAQHKGVKYYIVPALKTSSGLPIGCDGCAFYNENHSYALCPHDEPGSRHEGCCGHVEDAEGSSTYGKFYFNWWVRKTDEAVAQYVAFILNPPYPTTN